MKQLFTFFILTISLLGFNSATYADDHGATSEDTEVTATDDQKKKPNKGGEEEEPECE